MTVEERRLVVLFDGVCNLCNSSVNFLLDRDKAGRFKFASLQSEAGKKLLGDLGAGDHGLSSIVFIEGDTVSTRSRAVIRICKYLPGIWRLAVVFLIVPDFIRDVFYTLIAENRYAWFGKRDACRIPEPGISDRFLKDL